MKISFTFKSSFFILSSLIFTHCNIAYAEIIGSERIEPIVITATLSETPVSKIANSVTVFDSKQIASMNVQTVADVIRFAPGIDIVANGGPGQPVSAFIRGAKSEQTLVMIDGVEINDPSTPSRSCDLANITLENVERIEIIRGPQSPLFGSDAIGGVINIITKRADGRYRANIAAEGGSFTTHIVNGYSSGMTDIADFSAGFSWIDTDGFSAASEDTGNIENDRYKNLSFTGNGHFYSTDILSFGTILRIQDSETDLDKFGSTGGDDPNYKSDIRQIFWGANGTLFLLDDRWKQNIFFSIADHKRELKDSPDESSMDSSHGKYNGKIWSLNWRNFFDFIDYNKIIAGIEYQKENADSTYISDSGGFIYEDNFQASSAYTASYYLQDQLNYNEIFFGTVGLRVDDHERFGAETTYRISPGLLIEKTGTSLKGSYSTGFKAPSLYQLFSPIYGNTDLGPEKTNSWEAGLVQSLFSQKVSVGLTYFKQEFKNMIDYEFSSSKYINIAKAESRGIELSANCNLINNLNLGAAYTYMKAEDLSDSTELLRRPKNKFSINANYTFLEKWDFYAGIIYVGERLDMNFSSYPSSLITLDSYTLVNLSLSWRASEHIRLYGRIDNVFDEDYQEVYGYGTPGVAAYGGIKISY
ncbi:MAG: TonB-dependent receptor [Candidatus Theseobacter exili]|nr:TonB-dependent receptor [Candidatus Theseobacter exili]